MESLSAGGIATLVILSLLYLLLFASTKNGAGRPNHMWGIKTKATLSSDEAWTAGHLAARPYLLSAIIIGVPIAIAAISSAALNRPGMAAAAAWGGAIIQLIICFAGVAAANKAATFTSRFPSDSRFVPPEETEHS